MSGWTYVKEGLLGDDQVGPVTAEALLQLALEGKLKPETLVSHPTNTQGQWIQMQHIAGLVKKYNEGVVIRQREKEAKKAERDAQAQTKRAEADQQRAEAEARRRDAAERLAADQARLPFAKYLLDGQPQAVVAKVYDHVRQILTREESVEYIAVQAKPVAVAQDCVVVTNRRFMVFRQKLLGQVSFEDYLWLHLFDAKLKEGVLFADISLRATNGQVLTLGYLPKEQARHVYRIAQEREEAAMEQRRQREMEERRSGASQLVVNAPIPAASPAPLQNNSTPVPMSEDPIAKLQKLKTMLDMGLIQQSEYDETKARILSSL